MSQPQEGKLSKEEVDALLEATREEPAMEERPEPARRVQGYNFLQPSRFNKSQLERLRRINEALAQQAVPQVSRLLRSNIKAQLVSMDHMPWENLLEEAGPTCVAFVIDMEPLGYRGLFTVDRGFALACLEWMVGGQAEQAEAEMDLTDLDVRIFASFVRSFLRPLPELWQRIGQFQVELGPFVKDLQGLELFASNEDFFQVCYLMQSSVGSGQVALCVPFQAVRSLPPEAETPERAPAASDRVAQAALRESVRGVDVELAVLLGGADIKLAQLVRAEPGDIISLNTRPGDPLDVRLNDVIKLRGLPGTANGKYAVQLLVEEGHRGGS